MRKKNSVKEIEEKETTKQYEQIMITLLMDNGYIRVPAFYARLSHILLFFRTVYMRQRKCIKVLNSELCGCVCVFACLWF